MPVLLTGSNESSGLDPLRQFPVILSSASVWTVTEMMIIEISFYPWHMTWCHIIHFRAVGTKVTHCSEPETLQKVHEGCLKSCETRTLFELPLWFLHLCFENMTKIKHLPHVKILLLLGLKKEAFVAIFDLTNLGTKHTFSYPVMQMITN